MSLLSVVLPAYNEELMIAKATRVLGDVLRKSGISYELILVNDGSKDNTWEEIEKAATRDPNVRGICFSRNFGKESAVFAGLSYASGDAVAVMDCDLQHPPGTLIEMYRRWEEGYEVVEGVKIDRGKESALHRMCAGAFYQIMSKITKVDMQNASDFKLLDRKAVDNILLMPERNMFFRATSSWVGFRSVAVPFEVQERQAGNSKWSGAALVRYAFTNIVSFTTAPLQLVSVIGLLCFVCSCVLLVYTLIQYAFGRSVEGYTTLLVVLLFIGSAIMVSLGIIGCYIARIYDEVRQRPRYIVSRTSNAKKKRGTNPKRTEIKE
jgi:dolichol-phosphate mannosyltransferase